MARQAKREKTDVAGINHRKMRLRGGAWNGVVVRQYAYRVGLNWMFADELVLDSAHVYQLEQPATAKKPGTMRHIKKV